MKLDRAVSIQMTLQRRVRDIVTSATIFQITHAEMTERYTTLFDQYPKDLPHHVRAYIRGYYSALVDSLYHVKLSHGYLWEGTVYEKYESYPEPLKEALRHSTDTVPHGHYWKASLTTKQNRPFFVQ